MDFRFSGNNGNIEAGVSLPMYVTNMKISLIPQKRLGRMTVHAMTTAMPASVKSNIKRATSTSARPV